MTAYPTSSRILPSTYVGCQIHAEPQRVSVTQFLTDIVTNSASSLLCAHLPLNYSNMNDSSYSTDADKMQVLSTLTRLTSILTSFLSQVLGRQGASRHRNSQRTRSCRTRAGASPERITANVTPQPKGSEVYVLPTTRIENPTATTAIFAWRPPLSKLLRNGKSSYAF